MNLCNIIETTVNTDWKYVLLNGKNFLIDIQKKINEDIKKFEGHFNVFPEKNYVFNAFNHFNYKDLKVVIIGQDCYHNPKQAHGLCFSVPKGIKIPPSLRNIYKELNDDVSNFIIPKHGYLEKWAKQGVLLLNAALSVREKKPGSHLKYWIPYTDRIIKYISDHSSNIIFLLWGNFARRKKNIINTDQHFILEATHPSPLAMRKNAKEKWFGSKHFSKTNELLTSIDKPIINWNL